MTHRHPHRYVDVDRIIVVYPCVITPASDFIISARIRQTNKMLLLQSKMPGRNKKARLGALFHELSAFYGEHGVEARLQTLIQTMMKKGAVCS